MPRDDVTSYFSPSVDNPVFDLVLKSGVSERWVFYFAALAILGLIWASFMDVFRGRMLPDIVPLVIAVGGLAAAPFIVDRPWINLVCAAGVGVLFGLGVIFGWVGLGDVKYYVAFALAGGLIGIAVIALAHVFAAVIGGGVALATRNRKLAVPMAPFMTLGALAAFFLAGAPLWIPLALLGVFLVVMIAGVIERQRFAPPTLVDVCAPLLEGRADRIRVRVASRPSWRGVDGEWHEAEAGRRMSSGLLDLLMHGLDLTPEEQQEFYAFDQVLVERDVEGATLAIRLDAGMYHRLTLRAVLADDRTALAE